MPSANPTPVRSRRFREQDGDRFWWHHLDGTDYVPAIYQVLSDEEWQIMEDWYTATLAAEAIGEINVPAMSLIQGFVSGGGLSRVVQLGHYYGYSTLLIGFWLRAMAQGGKLFSVDIDLEATAFTQEWVDRAGLGDQVELLVADSAARSSLDAALAALGGPPELLLVDSLPQYEHARRELDLWVPAMAPQSILLRNDSSSLARQWDATGKGGVQKAFDDWLRRRKDVAFLNLNRRVGEPGVPAPTYRDGVGLGILQKL